MAKENDHFQVGNHFSVVFVPIAPLELAEGNLQLATATSAYFGGSLKLEFRPKDVPGLCLFHSRGVTSSGAELKYRKNSGVL